MEERNQGVLGPLLGSILFFCVAPGGVAGIIPGELAGWQIKPSLLDLAFFRPLGVLLITIGSAGLVDSFLRFIFQGRGTPAPVSPPKTLVVSGLYRYVRNPMYLAVVATILGQALLFGSERVLIYAAIIGGLFHLFVIAYEEPTLLGKFGKSYRVYQAGVRRWWPRVKPWTPAEERGLKPNND